MLSNAFQRSPSAASKLTLFPGTFHAPFATYQSDGQISVVLTFLQLEFTKFIVHKVEQGCESAVQAPRMLFTKSFAIVLKSGLSATFHP